MLKITQLSKMQMAGWAQQPLRGRAFTYIGAWATSPGLSIKRSHWLNFSSRNKTKEQKANKGGQAIKALEGVYQPELRTLYATV